MILSVKDLKFSIGEAAILTGVSFEIPKGMLAGIIGPNGSGKTTLFNCISGFNIPSAGTVSFDGKDVTDLSAHSRALLGMGRVFQNFGIFRELTVIENVMLALESRDPFLASLIPGSSRTKRYREEAMNFLCEVKLESASPRKAGSLSGGQMRLLEIIRTLAFNAELFLLDEPTAGVSPKMKEDVGHLIGRLKSMGKTVLVIEHDINFIQSFAERIIVMDLGQIFLDGSPGDVIADPRLREIYFGTGSSTEM